MADWYQPPLIKKNPGSTPATIHTATKSGTEIYPISSFACAKRSLIRYGFSFAPRAIRYGADIPLVSACLAVSIKRSCS